MPLSQCSQLFHSNEQSEVDIVAIHGHFENEEETWTDKSSGVHWLRDLLPQRLPQARILLHSYDISSSESSLDPPSWVDSRADSFLADLAGDRDAANINERPLIFICHGFGGIIVQRALSLSKDVNNRRLHHLRSVYVSTFAVIFLGTPHLGYAAEGSDFLRSEQKLVDLNRLSQVLDSVQLDFVAIMDRFQVYCFWEEHQTKWHRKEFYVVDRHSAAPDWPDIERAGVAANHSRMCKYQSANDGAFKLLLNACQRYVRNAIREIPRRHEQDLESSRKSYEAQVAEVLDLYPPKLVEEASDTHDVADPAVMNVHFFIPRSASSIFTGRRRLARKVENAFFANSPTSTRQHRIFVLYGLGGSGKTEFCLRFAQDCKERFWGIFWIDASTEQNANNGLAALGTVGKKDHTPEAGKHWLSTTTRPWLLVIDNVDDIDLDVSKLFPAVGNTAGHILITTRNRGNTIHATVGVEEFREMEPEEAITLLLKASRPLDAPDCDTPGRRAVAARVAKLVGYLALALTQAGKSIQRNVCTLQNYPVEYSKYRRFIKDSQSFLANDDRLNIITTWQIPLDRVMGLHTIASQDAMDLLNIMAFLHFEQIPEILFTEAWTIASTRPKSQPRSLLPFRFFNNKPEQSGLPPVITTPYKDRDEFGLRLRGGLALLSDLALIYYDSETMTCAMHPVVHAWARERLSKEQRIRWLGITMSILSDSISPSWEANGRAYRRSLLPHLESCLNDENYRVGTNTDIDASRTLKIASAFAECGMWKRAYQLQSDVVRVRTTQFGPTNPATLEAISDLGHTCWNLFRVKECLKLQTAVFESRDKKLGHDHAATLKAMDDLAHTYWLIGQRDKAAQLGVKALAGLTKHLGDLDPSTLTAMHNLGCTYLHLSRLEDSFTLLSQVLDRRTALWGPRHGDTLATVNELAMAELKLNRLDSAERHCADGLRGRRALLGDEHAYTLWSVNNMSKILVAQHRADEAVEMLREILPVVARTLGERHVGMSMTKFNLASAFAGRREWGEAERLLKEQLDIVERGHRDWVISMALLGKVLDRLGRVDEALEVCKEVLVVVGWDIDSEQEPEDGVAAGVVARVRRIEAESTEQPGGTTEGASPSVPAEANTAVKREPRRHKTA